MYQAQHTPVLIKRDLNEVVRPTRLQKTENQFWWIGERKEGQRGPGDEVCPSTGAQVLKRGDPER